MVRLPTRLPVLDVLLAGVLVVAAVISAAGNPALPHIGGSIICAVWAGSLALRTSAPFLTVVVASLGAVGYAVLPAPTTPLWSFVVLLVVVFSAGAHLTGRWLWMAAALLLVSIYVVQILEATRPGGDRSFADVYLSPPVLVGAPILAGMLLRRSRHQTAELRRLGAELAAEREAHEQAAAAAERNRIARELHDVISHSVSVMVVQAGAAEQQLTADSPAREQLLAVRRTGKEALTELRRQLGVLREGPDESPAPMPALGDVVKLADESGASLDYDTASVGDVPPGLGLAAYRVVQEALTNARRHAAGAPVRVRVGRDGDGLAVDVVNGPGRNLTNVANGPGHGLTGMGERVGMYAGRLEFGRTDEGGWRVHARLPIPTGGASS